MLEIMQVANLDKVQTKIRGIDIDIAVDMNTIYPHPYIQTLNKPFVDPLHTHPYIYKGYALTFEGGMHPNFFQNL